MTEECVINFYSVGDEYGEFSNFALLPIILEEKEWPTSEHYFQAKKFHGTEHEEAVRNTNSPMAAAKMGRERWRPLREDWEDVKDDVMRLAVEAKTTQHYGFRKRLLDTGKALLVEHTKNDSYWGDGGDGSGKNMLGITLMNIREKINKHLNNAKEQAYTFGSSDEDSDEKGDAWDGLLSQQKIGQLRAELDILETGFRKAIEHNEKLIDKVLSMDEKIEALNERNDGAIERMEWTVDDNANQRMKVADLQQALGFLLEQVEDYAFVDGIDECKSVLKKSKD